MAWHYVLSSTHKKPFCEYAVCLPCPKRVGDRDPLILYSHRLLPPSLSLP